MGTKKENPFFSSIFHAFKSDHVATSAKVQSCLKLARSNDCGGAFESLLQAMPFFKCFWLDTAARCFLDTFFLAAENLDGRIFDPGMEAWKVGSCQPSGKEERKKLDAANASGHSNWPVVSIHTRNSINGYHGKTIYIYIYTNIYIYKNKIYIYIYIYTYRCVFIYIYINPCSGSTCQTTWTRTWEKHIYIYPY